MNEICCVVRTLKKEFDDYMRAHKHPMLRLFGLSKYLIRCKVLIREGRSYVLIEGTKLVVLQFECKDAYCSRAIYVTKIGCNRKRDRCCT